VVDLVESEGRHLSEVNWDLDHCFYFAFSKLKLKEYESSLQGWDCMLQRSPQYWKAHYFKGLCLSSMENYRASVRSFEECLQLKPTYYKAWFQQGNCFLFLGEFEKAEERFTGCINLKGDFCQAWTNLGNCHLQTGKFERAIECYDSVLEKNPDNHIAWYNKGYASDELGNDPDALYCFQKCLDLKEDYVKGWFNLAVVQSKLRLFELSLQNFEKCLELDPHFIRALNDKGYLLNKMDRLEEAFASFRLAQEINPKYPDCLNGQAMILKKQGCLDEAKDLLDQALLIYRSFIRAYINRADLFRRKGQIEKCKEDLETIEKMVGSQTQLDRICHTPKKFLELRYFSCYKSLLAVFENLSKSTIQKKDTSANESFETFLTKRIDEILMEEINDIASNIDMKADITQIEQDIKDIHIFQESKKYIFENFRRSNLCKPIGSIIYKKRIFELILKHKRKHLATEQNLVKPKKKFNKFYEWFFRSWNQKFENAVSLTHEFIKQEITNFDQPMVGDQPPGLESSIIQDDVRKADLHYQKFIQILVNAESYFEDPKHPHFRDIFQSDMESFGFNSTYINFASMAKLVIHGN
jgi:tetratricopeptide (TPR) repeat protein